MIMIPETKMAKGSGAKVEADAVPKKRGRPPKNLQKPNAIPPKRVGRPRKVIIDTTIVQKTKPKS